MPEVTPAVPTAEPTPPAAPAALEVTLPPATPAAEVTPAAAPAPAPAEGSAVDWVEESTTPVDDDTVVAPAVEPKPVVAPAPLPPTPALAPVAAPAPALVPAVVAPAPILPATPAPAAPALAAVQPPAPAPAKEPTQEELAAASTKLRSEFAARLEALYAVPEVEADELITAPAKALPRMAAQLHMNVLEAAVQGILMEVPAIVDRVFQARQRHSENERSFFEKWPKLVDPQHRPAVARFMQVYRASNPTASKEQAIAEVGAMAMVALRIPPDIAPIPPPALVAAPMQQGFVPAAPGGSAARPTAPVKSQWDELLDEFKAEEAA